LEKPDDVGALAHHLGRLIGDTKLRGSLAAEARRTAERYSWNRVASETLAVYQNVLERTL
jgi:glycosyltransferase involved in cell wall biosynthesis